MLHHTTCIKFLAEVYITSVQRKFSDCGEIFFSGMHGQADDKVINQPQLWFKEAGWSQALPDWSQTTFLVCCRGNSCCRTQHTKLLVHATRMLAYAL